MIHYVLAFLSGILVKLVDDIEDKKKGKNPLKWLFSIWYGLTIGYVISQSSFSMLFLGALLAQVIGGKIDKQSHLLGFLVAIVSALYFGLPLIEFLPFIIFLVAAYLDEFTLPAKWSMLTDYRLFLKLAALAFIFVGRFDYLLAILLFDLAYMLVGKIDHTKLQTLF